MGRPLSRASLPQRGHRWRGNGHRLPRDAPGVWCDGRMVDATAQHANQKLSDPRHPPRTERAEPSSAAGGRREVILEALAVELETERLANLSVEGIAARAGISRTRFYRYFTSKHDAFGALLDRISNELLAEYRAPDSWFVRPPSARPRAAMEETFMRVFALWDRRSPILREASDLWNLPPEVAAHWHLFMARIIEVAAEAIDRERRLGIAVDGSDAKALATALLWQGERLLFLKVSNSIAFDAFGSNEELRDVAVGIWMRAIYAQDDPRPER